MPGSFFKSLYEKSAAELKHNLHYEFITNLHTENTNTHRTITTLHLNTN